MSTFGSLNTAYTGLSAARQGLAVTGQNIANAGTAGYTRQRLEQGSVSAPANTGLVTTTSARPGQGVETQSIARLGSTFLDARARSTAADASFTFVRANAFVDIETVLAEPGKNGLSTRLQSFWASWQDVSNNPGEAAQAGVLLEEASALAAQISNGYTQMESQWRDTRGTLDTLVTELNGAAATVGELNVRIRDTLAAGGSANELIDQRSQLTSTISSLAGGTVRENPDGMVDVLIGGNAIVSGSTVHSVRALGSGSMGGASADPARIEWVDRPLKTVAPSSGEIAGTLTVLAAADGGKGGPIAEAAASFNSMAQNLAETVNAVHRTGTSANGATGQDFFSYSPADPARSLTVIPQSAAEIATAATGAGGRDGSIADAISQIGTGTGSPDDRWNTFVTKVGVDSRGAIQAGVLADRMNAAAISRQVSGASVSLDEESMNLMTYQHAYQASARVMTALDEALDKLINGTGLVGR